MRRPLSLVTGLGALVALIVMLVFVAIGPDDEGGDETRPGRFPAGSLAVAVQDEQLTSASPELIAERVQRVADTGVAFTRVDVRWFDLASSRPAAPTDPADPAYAWGRYDAVLDGLAARSIEPIVVFSGSPAWANGGKEPAWAPTLDDYGAFVRAFATRYSGGAHANVRLFEPWDEPNSPASLLPQWDETVTPATPVAPTTYAAMLDRATSEITAVNDNATIIGLSLAHVETSAPPLGGISVLDFIQGLEPLAPKMDAAAIHLEPGTAPNAPSESVPSFATVPRLIEQIDRVAPDVPLLVTRFGYPTLPGGVSEDEQALSLTQALERLAAVPRVRLAVWYALQDTSERPSGLLRADGSEKPAWATFVGGPKSLQSATP